MKGYLLDTNICIFALRGEHGIGERMRQCGKDSCYVSDVTIMELRYGAYKSRRTEEDLALIDNFLKKVKVVRFADTIDLFCQEKIRLEALGKKLEDYDLLIGCAAKAKGLTMVTDNVKHFDRIEGIEIENWVKT
jgi:tRNA(fMet)-specific endonuclease VapC